MSKRFFGDIGPVRYEGVKSDNPYAYRHYDPSRVVAGKTMAEHLRPAVCYWHNFAWMGTDMFGAPTFNRPWDGETMKGARAKADVAFEMFSTLGFPFFTFHDRDVVPEGDSLKEFGRNLAEMTDLFAKKMQKTGAKLLWGTANLFSHPRYLAGAATNPDPNVFAYAAAQVKNAIDATHKLDGANYVLWGGREGSETDSCRRPDEGIKRLREALNYLCEYSLDQKYGYNFALEAKPNEPRADIYMPTTGAYLGFIETLDHKDMVGVNPEVAHEHMAGLNFTHGVAQAWEAGKLFHIDLNDQSFGRYDQDLRFGSHNLKSAFFLVKYLEDVGYAGSRHFDAHAYRTEDYEGVKDFARGCMRNYLILKDKAAQWNANKEIASILKEVSSNANGAPKIGSYSKKSSAALLAHNFDKDSIMKKRLPYERLDQLTIDILTGAR